MRGNETVPAAVLEWPAVDCVEAVKAGERGVFGIDVDLAEEGRATVFQYVVRGKSDGPVFHLLAGQHGVELNGCAAVEAFVNLLDPEALSGTVLAVPVANPVSAARGEQYPEFDGDLDDNMNRIWPGRPDGTFIERLADAIWRNGLSTCDWCMDVHSWSGGTAPAALFSFESDELVAFGRATGLLFLRITERLPDGYKHYAPLIARRQGRAIGCCVELSGQYLIYPDQVEVGVGVLANLLKHAGMLPGEPAIPERQINLVDAESIEIKSPADALIQQCVPPGEAVKAGEPIARLWRFDTGRAEWLVSPADGGLWALASLDQMRAERRGDRGMSSAVRAGEHVATVYAF